MSLWGTGSYTTSTAFKHRNFFFEDFMANML